MKLYIRSIHAFSETDYTRLYNKIRSSKRKQIDLLMNTEDKKRSLVGEYLLMKVLEEYTISYQENIFYYNKNGKPFIKGNPFYFNISHKNDYVVLIVDSTVIGIDIEYNKNKNVEQFTKKEAYLKMLGNSILEYHSLSFKSMKAHFLLLSFITDYLVCICSSNPFSLYDIEFDK